MAELEKIKFVHEDADLIISDTKAFYEQLLNRQIAPADLEMLLINGLAYRELLLRSGINDAARQNLVAFARGYALELLGELVGVYRLPAASATTNIEFNLVEGHNGVIIPEGLRVQSTDGNVIFSVFQDTFCPPGTLTKQIAVSSNEAGKKSNGYAIGTIAIILDPQAFLKSAANLTITSGGTDEETDDQLRERIKLAPASFSVAGPVDAYRFFAKSAHPSIIDVAITSPIPGQVNIYPLMAGGEMPSEEILTAVQAACNAEKIRPLTDTVVTEAPETIDFNIEVNLTLLSTAVEASKVSDVVAALNSFKETRKNKMGLDIVIAKIAALCMIEGVYNVNVIQPAVNIVATPEQYTRCGSITVNVIGTHDE